MTNISPKETDFVLFCNVFWFFKTYFSHWKTRFCIPSAQKSFHWVISYLWKVFFTWPSLEKFVPCRNSLKGQNKSKLEGARSGLRRMCQLFPTQLTDGFHFSCCCMKSFLVLVKPINNWLSKRQGHHEQLCVLYPKKLLCACLACHFLEYYFNLL